ncbi:MAG: Arc family DNA-binding protein [Janthinobacterium lividum]
MATKQDDFIKTALRLPRDLHSEVQESAEKNGRSMNAEIIARLEQASRILSPAGQGSSLDVKRQLDEIFRENQSHIDLLTKYYDRATSTLMRAVILLRDQKTPAKQLNPLMKELAGLTYFLGVIEGVVDPEQDDMFDEISEDDPSIGQIRNKP